MHPQQSLKRIIYQAFTLFLITFLSGITSLVHSQQPPSENELGMAPYPQASYLHESTRRIESGKAPSWMAVAAYHTNDSISDVTKYFKKKAKELNFPTVSNPIINAMLLENWAIDSYRTIGSAPTLFQFTEELRASKKEVRTKNSFGIFILSDSIVRVHLISPHPAENSTEIIPGTMIVIVRERLPSQNEGNISEQDNKIYKPSEVTVRAHILSRPEPEYTDEARRQGISGTVVLRGAFAASGKVEIFRVVSGLPGGLTEVAIKAARQIKFAPAVKDGRYVSMYIQIEYNFNL
jgi:TonB family protein